MPYPIRDSARKPRSLLLPAVLCLALLLCILNILNAQSSDPYNSPHERQARVHPLPGTPSALTRSVPGKHANALSKIVFGYHPYWISQASVDNYRFDLLSHIAYFSYEVDPATGSYTTIHDWLTTPLFTKARAAGTRVLLSVTNFGASQNRMLLSSKPARDTLIEKLRTLIAARNADGVNIDFEGIPADQRDNFVMFIENLAVRLKTLRSDMLVTVAAPAVDWNNAWNISALSAYIDVFFVMCYDYSWSGGPTAGPVAPLQGLNYNVTRTLDWYVAQGAPKGKIVMGVPYYGYDWPAQSDQPLSPTTGTGLAVTYSHARNMLSSYQRKWSDTYLNPWFAYQSPSWHQCWYDDEESLSAKYDLVLQRNLAGIGIWALGYDEGYSELWELLAEKFLIPSAVQDVHQPGSVRIESLFPIPLSSASRSLCIQLSSLNSNLEAVPFEIHISDMLGRECVFQSGLLTSESMVAVVDVENLAPGPYRLLLRTSSAVLTRTFIVLN